MIELLLCNMHLTKGRILILIDRDVFSSKMVVTYVNRFYTYRCENSKIISGQIPQDNDVQLAHDGKPVST